MSRQITVGSLVTHPKFGKGVVSCVRPAYEVWDTKGIAEVRFDSGTVKTFLLRFSKLEVTGHTNTTIQAFENLHEATHNVKTELIKFFRIDKVVDWLSRKLKF